MVAIARRCEMDKAHMSGTVNIHRRHQTKGFLIGAADGLVIGGCFLARRTT